MAQIPMGEFGAARALPKAANDRIDTSATNIAGRGAGAMAEALGQAGQVAGNIASSQKAEESRQAEALARAKAANAHSGYQLDVQAAVESVDDTLRRGGDYTKAGELYEAAVEKIKPPQVDGLPPEALESYTGAIANGRKAGRLKIDNLVQTARRDDGQRQFSTAIDLAGKTAGMAGADVAAVNAQLRASEEFYITGFGLDRSVTSKAIQDRIDANWTSQAAQRFNAGNEDPDALRTLLNDVTAPDGFYGDKLDAEKRNAIAAHISNRIDTLENKAERKTDKIDAIAEKVLGAMDEQTASGVPPTVEQWSSWSDAMKVASPERQAEFNQRIVEEREVQSFLRLPIDQQLAGLQQREADLYTKGGDKGDRTNFGRIKSAVEANVKLLKETPLQFAVTREGSKIEPLKLDAIADPAQMPALTAQLQQRATLVAELRKKYGPQVRNRILLPQEAALVVSTISKLPPAQKVEIFGGLRKAAGSAANYGAIMGQIAPDAPVLAHAGLLHLRNPKAALLVVTGEAILNRTGKDDGKFTAVKLPEQADFDRVVSDAVGNAFRDRPEALNVAMQAVRAGYMGATVTDGEIFTERDTEKRIKNIVTGVLGTATDYNGRGHVFVPYGMDEDDFEDRVEATWAGLQGQLPPGVPTDLEHYGLQQHSEGRYYVTAGRMFVKGADGKDLLIEIKR